MEQRMSNKGKKKVACAHANCKKHSFLTNMEISCHQDVGIPWMCDKHDEQRLLKDLRGE
jgi:hypothetical protein